MSKDAKTSLLIVLYLLAIVLANVTVAMFGAEWSIINAFLFIGFDLACRDILHARFTRTQMIGLIFIGGAISWLLNQDAGIIAIASFTAFTASQSVDYSVYSILIKRPYIMRANASNSAGAFVDSIIFPLIAFGAFLPAIMLGQFVAKVAGGALWAWVLNRYVKFD